MHDTRQLLAGVLHFGRRQVEQRGKRKEADQFRIQFFMAGSSAVPQLPGCRRPE